MTDLTLISLFFWRAGPSIPTSPLQVSTSYSVQVSFSEGPRLFFCQLCDFVDAVQELELKLAKWVAQTPSLTEQPAVGTVCAARFSADEQWYRAVVLDTCDPKSCKVRSNWRDTGLVVE